MAYSPIPVDYNPIPAHKFKLVTYDGGVCVPQGIRASGIHAGFRDDPKRLDMALVASDETCVAAATFTTNRFAAAPVLVSREHLLDGRARAVVLNSGNANAATGDKGLRTARESARIVAGALGCDERDVLVCSTGVIGIQLDIEPYVTGAPAAVAALAHNRDAGHAAACAVMTTDTHSKEIGIELERQVSEGMPIHVGGFVKGSGMIMPNMATMLAVLTTDAPLTAEAAQHVLSAAVQQTFNKVTVDSDTSTNDTCILLATGKAGGEPIGIDSCELDLVACGVFEVCNYLAQQIAGDGEGASFMVRVDVVGAPDDASADVVARSIANSPLVKTAIAGHDANWGRVAAAAGKCGVEFDQSKVDIDFFGVPVLRAGLPVGFSEEHMLELFASQHEVRIAVDLHAGIAATHVWTCDLTHDYIVINGDYRT